ncbi:MAG: DUF2505 family protein [Acidimicrobiales bacterium]
MRFEVEQRFGASVDDVEAAFLDPDLLGRLDGLPSLGRPEVLDQVEAGETVRQRVRYRFTGRLSAAVTAVVDPARLTWVQESVVNRRTHRADIAILPDHYPDRLRCEGTIELRGLNGGGCVRLTEGDIDVRFPVVAAKVERAIVTGLQSHAHAEVAIVEQWLKERDPR